jgi:hypothetical protein
MPTETPPRPAEAPSWNAQDLTSERDVELDTVTTDQQVEIRQIATKLVKKPVPTSG